MPIECEALDHLLRRGTAGWIDDERKGFVLWFERILKSQRERMAFRERLRPSGASVAIDAVLLRLMRRAGLDDAKLVPVLRDLRDGEARITGAAGVTFDVRWKEGILVGRSAEVEGGVTWRDGTVHFAWVPRRFDGRVVCMRLVDVHPDPAFFDRTIVRSASRGRARGKPGELGCDMPLAGIDLEAARIIEFQSD